MEFTGESMLITLETPMVFLRASKSELASQWLAPVPPDTTWGEEDKELVLYLVRHAADRDPDWVFPYEGEDSLREYLHEARELGLMKPGDAYCVATPLELWEEVQRQLEADALED